MSPYPPGLDLPELARRQSCTAVWPPVFAADDAKPVGAFTLITRKDGRKQWAYDEHALYTSILDKVPGDVIAATTRKTGGDGPAAREVASVPPAVPPGFSIATTTVGRQLLTDKYYSIYAFDKDGPEKSNCDAACARTWAPVIAAASARSQGEWSTFERSPGIRQWAFRKKPLYTNVLDPNTGSLQGSDVPGWHNVYAQKAPPPPTTFTMQDSEGGVVLADARGKTIYTYNCADDSFDQLACDHPDAPQAYRLAICGGGNVERCLRTWPYVAAEPGASSTSRTWRVMEIDPQTGRVATPGQQGAVRVWAYLGSPVYTFAGDEQPGDIKGDGNGEFGGSRNGFKAFFLRDDFFNSAG
jgi:predicted lipoprotein with Yx(FWY)xxD motif